MKSRIIFIAATLVVLLLVWFVVIKPSAVDGGQNDFTKEEKEAARRAGERRATASSADVPDPDDPRLTRRKDGSVEFNPAVEISRSIGLQTSSEERMSIVSQLFDWYRLAYKENPVGVENFEFTEQLLGRNPMKIVFIASNSKALIGRELVDEWGTAYFFHPVSSTEMGIVSAGADREFWTEDDISIGDESPSQ